MIPTSDVAGIIRMQAASYGDTDSMVQEKLKKARTEESIHINSIPHSIAMGMDFKPETSSNREFLTKFGDARRSVEETGYSLLTAGAAAAHGGCFGAPYAMGDIGRFDPEQFVPRYHGNGVSLTLGLQHYELSGAQPSFLFADSIPLGHLLDMDADAGDFCILKNAPSVAHSSNAFENINIQNNKGFAATLLPDFVA